MSDFISGMIPFLFVLAVVYGALEVSDIFKKNSVKAIISLALAAFTLTSPELSAFLNSILPYAVILFVAVFFLGFLLHLFKGKKEADFSMIVIVGVLVLIFLANWGQEQISDLFPSLDTGNLLAGAAILLVILVLYAVGKIWGGK